MNNILNKLKDIINGINNKYSSFIDKNKFLYFLPKNFFLFIFFVIMLFTYVDLLSKNDIVIRRIKNQNGVLDEIVDKSVNVDIDVTKIDNIDKIGLYFATYSRKNDSIYRIKIYEDNNIIYQKKFNSKKIEDNALKFFKSNIKNINHNSKYTLELEPVDVKVGRGITVYKEKDNNIAYAIINKSLFYNEAIIIGIIFLILYFVVNIMINKNIIKSEKKYYLLMLVYIIPILFLTPPLEVPDEHYHFFKSYRVSQFEYDKNLKENVSKKLIVPENYECLYHSSENNENIINKDYIKDCLKNSNNIKEKIYHGNSSNRLFTTIFGAFGIKIADIFTNSPIIIFYAGRLFTFLLAYLIVLKCFKFNNNYNRILLIICSIPMFIQQMISYSYDGLLNSLCVFLICFLLSKIEGKSKFTIKDFILFSIISIMIMIIKLPYILISGLILFINFDKFGNKKYIKYIKIVFMFIFILVTYKLIQIVDGYGLGDYINQNSDKNTIMDLIVNPKNTIMLLLRTLKYRFMDFYFYALIGVIGYLTYHFNHLFIKIYYIVLLLVAFSKEFKISKKFKIFSLFIFLAISAAIVLAMYLSWTSKNSLTIEGVQGRYFIPILPLLFITLIPSKKKIDISDNFIYSFINISMITYIITILVSFY